MKHTVRLFQKMVENMFLLDGEHVQMVEMEIHHKNGSPL